MNYLLGCLRLPHQKRSGKLKNNTFRILVLLDNDEHAAKRVSDAFDTATELRDEELGGASSFGLARPSDGERNEKAGPVSTYAHQRSGS
jgi:hypothetical protein